MLQCSPFLASRQLKSSVSLDAAMVLVNNVESDGYAQVNPDENDDAHTDAANCEDSSSPYMQPSIASFLVALIVTFLVTRIVALIVSRIDYRNHCGIPCSSPINIAYPTPYCNPYSISYKPPYSNLLCSSPTGTWSPSRMPACTASVWDYKGLGLRGLAASGFRGLGS